jgi:hypothetical protein
MYTEDFVEKSNWPSPLHCKQFRVGWEAAPGILEAERMAMSSIPIVIAKRVRNPGPGSTCEEELF